MTEHARHIALIGFMGSGKTVVGKQLASVLNRPFIDLDEYIEKRAGKSVREIFDDDGEASFRRKEAEALHDQISGVPKVIATGGGVVGNQALRSMLKQRTHCVYLRATENTLRARLGSPEEQRKRPLLESGLDHALANTLPARVPFYEQAHAVVDVDVKNVSEIVGEIVTDLPETSPHGSVQQNELGLSIKAQRCDYDVVLKENANGWIGHKIKQLCRGQKVAIISDTTVAKFYSSNLISELRALDLKVSLHTFLPGERSKNIDTIKKLYDSILSQEITRQDMIVAFGGGVVGDMAGFVAATVLRGIDFIQVPTTTLSVIDSSVGGKTGFNAQQGKNLIGAFYAPNAVFVATEFLKSQAPHAHAAGLVEAVKVAATRDEHLFNRIVQDTSALLEHDPSVLLPTLYGAIGLKADIVREDEREQGLRAVLNYGHTVGHAIEAGEDYRLYHGEAVALGMIAESQWAESKGLSHGVKPLLETALSGLQMRTDWQNVTIQSDALDHDKKRVADHVLLPIVDRPGHFHFEDVSIDELKKFFAQRSDA